MGSLDGAGVGEFPIVSTSMNAAADLTAFKASTLLGRGFSGWLATVVGSSYSFTRWASISVEGAAAGERPLWLY
jgi:hypothetical protein